MSGCSKVLATVAGRTTALLAVLSLLAGGSISAAADKTLAPGHVPEAVKHLSPVGLPAATNQLDLAIGLPLRNTDELTRLLADLYDPASPNFRHFLTSEEFTARFSPTAADYQAVLEFARAAHLKVSVAHSNRLLLNVSGTVADVENAFHIKLRTYRHPSGQRDFFAPDTEPSVAATLPILDVSGLNNFSLPRPRIRQITPALQIQNAQPKSGSAPGGGYRGGDFRAAYVPGTTLDGSGQVVGLLQFDGFYANDITAYEAQAGLPNVTLQTVLLDGYNGVPTTGTNSGNGEVSLDIEMAISMAPGLAKIILYEAGPTGQPNDVLNRMATDNAARQLSCSWGWSGGPSATTDQIFKQMATQGQSFFCASGDSDAFTSGSSSANGVDNASLANAPTDSPYLTAVGGTTLSTSGPGGDWLAETVWNWGGNTGSSGGISSHYAIPSWQQGVSMAANGGSVSFRNIPDVALTGDNVYVLYGNGNSANFGGTSCASPLWAAFTALVNQQAASYGSPSVGFLNPALYAVGASATYSSTFHDITTGNNFNSSSPNLFAAAAGYDLCTGWGTPAGVALINALAPLPEPLKITPAAGFAATGPLGGVFNTNAQNFALTNSGSTNLTWTLGTTAAWLDVSPTGGTILPGDSPAVVTASFNTAANNLLPGSYTNTVWFTNLNTGVTQSRQFTLQVTEPLVITPNVGFTASGLVSGAFNTNTEIFSLTNTGGATWYWSVTNTPVWLTVTPASGTLSPGGQVTVTASLNTNASNLSVGTYTTVVGFTNALTGLTQNRTFSLRISNSLVQNGGFESGNLTSWTASGNTTFTTVSTTSSYVHSGTYGLKAGPNTTLGFLSQTLPTTIGQTYLLSFWLNNPNAKTPNEIRVSWGGLTALDKTNIPAPAWTNLQCFVTATAASTVLQLGFRNDPSYFGLDDISVTPVILPALQLTPITSNATQPHFTWNTMTSLVYQIQYRTNLSQAGWIPLGSAIPATNSTTSFTDSNATDPQRFYRIVATPK